MKYCNRCKTEKPLTEYYISKGSRDGLQSICKSCSKEIQKSYYKLNRDDIRARNKKRLEDPQKKKKLREQLTKAAKKWRRKKAKEES